MAVYIKDIIKIIENFAPLYYQESYDNAGVQVGDVEQEAKGVLVTLDITVAVMDEAIAKGCNCIIAHHPLIFSAIRKITGKNETEQCIIKAIKHNIVLYAAHTNLDNMLLGVNKVIADRLQLRDAAILAPDTRHSLCKFICYVPPAYVEQVKNAIFNAGGGSIGNYSECSFTVSGTGTFRPGTDADPAIGVAGGPREAVEELKLEVLIPAYLSSAVLNAVRAVGYYEEVAYEIIPLNNTDQGIGAGYTGTLATPMEVPAFLAYLKDRMQLKVIRYAGQPRGPIRKVAVCGGSGSFLLQAAKGAQADIFITADYKYHQFFEAGNDILIADIGHYESEIFTNGLFLELLASRYPGLKIEATSVCTNPVKYYY
ncbi:MAG: Nif3-like dinuclear metal center hexameric protein [Bacteroidetes bacterium 47-18]|nr:MAG: Nif3-like dinuclear metal center hexameric protein [Bacteroidetes bacterium 47-18]